MDPDQILSVMDLHCFLKGMFLGSAGQGFETVLLCTTINELVEKLTNNFNAPIFGDMWSFK